MPWERLNLQTPRYALKVRDGQQIKTLYFATKAQADAFKANRKQEQVRIAAAIKAEQEIDGNLDRLDFLFNMIINHTLTCQGFVKRNGAWQLVSRLNLPLNKEEKSKIRSIKSRTQIFPLSRLFGRERGLGGEGITSANHEQQPSNRKTQSIFQTKSPSRRRVLGTD